MGNEGKWAEMWGKAKEDYKELTGSKKPEITTFFGLAKKHKTSVAGALRDVDKQYLAYRQMITDYSQKKKKEGDVHNSLNKFGQEVQKAFKQIDNYENDLNAQGKKLKDNNDKNIVYRAIKSMVAQLEAIKTEITKSQQALFNTFQANAEALRREAAKEPPMSGKDKVAYNEPIHVKSLQSGCAKHLAYVQQLKALLTKSPTDLTDIRKFYKLKMQTAARDITQPLENMDRSPNFAVPSKLAASRKVMVERNDGKASIDTLDAKAIAAEIKTLSQAAKEIATWAKSL